MADVFRFSGRVAKRWGPVDHRSCFGVCMFFFYGMLWCVKCFVEQNKWRFGR